MHPDYQRQGLINIVDEFAEKDVMAKCPTRRDLWISVDVEATLKSIQKHPVYKLIARRVRKVKQHSFRYIM